MAIEKEAIVRVRAEGEEDVARAAQKVDSAWKNAGTSITGAFKSAGGVVSETVKSIVTDIGHIVTAAGTIDFAMGVREVHRFEDSVSHLAIASGRSFQSVQGEVNALAQQINEMPEATAQLISSFAQMSYAGPAATNNAVRGMEEYALITGQAVQQVSGLAVALQTVGGAQGHVTEAMRLMVAQGQLFGRSAKEVGDAYGRLQGQIAGLEPNVPRTGALVAAFGGKTLAPQQREAALGSVMGQVEGNLYGFEHLLGRKLTGATGGIEDMPKVLEDVQRMGRRSSYMRSRIEAEFGGGIGGRKAMMALMATDFSAERSAENQSAPAVAPMTTDQWRQSEAGQRRSRDIQRNIEMQKMVGGGSWFGKAIDTVSDWSSKHPILTTVGGMFAGNALRSVPLGGAVGGAASALGTSAAGLLGAVGGGLAVGGLAGTGLDRLLGLSDYFSGTGSHSRVAEDDAIGYMRDKTQAAKSGSRAQMSAGMQQALASETQRKEMSATISELTKAGASLALAQETAKQLISSGQRPITIDVINATGAPIDAQLRGEQ